MRALNTAALRTLVIYAVILPLAVFIGWMAVDLANWNQTSFAVFATILFVLLLPALLKWHYAVMILSWNTAITIFFLPGKPTLWMLMAAINFAIAVLNRIMQKRTAFLPAPPITMSLLALLAVVLVTGKLRGGFGSQALGSASYGGKAYYYIIAAIIGYFAIASRPIPTDRARSYLKMFFLPGTLAGLSNLIYYAGPSFYFLYLILPVSFAGVQAMSEVSGPIVRIAGFSSVTSAVAFYLLAVHGIRGILRSWRLSLLLLASLAIGTLAGYRGIVALVGIVFVVSFILERLYLTPILPALLVAGALLFAALIPLSSKLPLSVQRTLSFVPMMEVDRFVRNDADSSIAWRLEMWRSMLPDLPKYIWLGKGFAINPTDLYLAGQAQSRHRALNPYEGSIVAGDYHSGPLSIYVPLGSFGLLAFIMFVATSLRALYLNYKYGDETLKVINRFLFAYFLGRLIFFVFAFGALSGDLFHFTGAVGLSVALNRGVCRKPVSISQPVRFRPDFGEGSTEPSPA